VRSLAPIGVALVCLATIAAAVEAPAVRVSTGRRRIVLRTQDATATVRLRRLQVTLAAGRHRLAREDKRGGPFYERGETRFDLGRVTDVEPLADGVQLAVDAGDSASAAVTLRFVSSRTLEVRIEPADPGTVTALGDRFRSPKGELIYGLTERLRDSPLSPLGVPTEDAAPVEVGSLDRKGEIVEMVVQPTFSLYAPFYQSSRGYGLAVAGTTFGAFDVGATDPGIVSLRFETGTTAASRALVYALIAGPDYATILDEYTARTGRPAVPPDWAFLHWRWRGELRTGRDAMLDGVLVNGDVAEDVLMYETYGIPAGVYLFDRPVLVGEPYDLFSGFDRFEWDETRLPNPAHMLQALTTRGYRLVMWSAAWVCGTDDGDNGIEAQQLGFIAPGPGGDPLCGELGRNSFLLDVTNPDARAWFRAKLAAFLAAWDIRGIKLDRGEEHVASEATDVWADGRTGREVRNDYPRLQAEMHHGALMDAFPDGDAFVVSRPAYTGTSQYAVFWGGDIPGSEAFGFGRGTDLGLRSAIISQQRAAFMGDPIWGSDTGGYYEFKDGVLDDGRVVLGREVFARWLEFSCFSGLMEIGGTGTHAPWDMPTDPAVDDELIAIYRTYTTLRQTLQPYVVAAAAEAATGMPIVRPMVFEDRKDKRLRDRWDEYMFGPDLLVAPVWRSGDRSREVYLPRGRWRSYWEPSETHRGRRTITVDAPLDVIPVFVREGAEVPGP
jgi:alpha-D-xyloside xylohydrolase